jgi:hypothetical protein
MEGDRNEDRSAKRPNERGNSSSNSNTNKKPKGDHCNGTRTCANCTESKLQEEFSKNQRKKETRPSVSRAAAAASCRHNNRSSHSSSSSNNNSNSRQTRINCRVAFANGKRSPTSLQQQVLVVLRTTVTTAVTTPF